MVKITWRDRCGCLHMCALVGKTGHEKEVVGVGGGGEPAEVTDCKITEGIRKGSVKM